MHKKNFFFPYKLIWISVHLYLLNLLIQIMECCYFKSKFCQGLWLVYMKSSEATYLVSTRELSLSLSLSLSHIILYQDTIITIKHAFLHTLQNLNFYCMKQI